MNLILMRYLIKNSVYTTFHKEKIMSKTTIEKMKEKFEQMAKASHSNTEVCTALYKIVHDDLVLEIQMIDMDELIGKHIKLEGNKSAF